MKTESIAAPSQPAVELEPSDVHHLNAAEGWLELGDIAEALGEVKQVSLQGRFHPRALLVRWEIFARKQHWEFAHTIAEGLVALTPEDPRGWLHRSAALHALKRTPEAWQSLLPAAARFPRNPTVAYKLACYACQLGHFEEAKGWLDKATSMKSGNKLKWLAVIDPSLHPLWEHFGHAGDKGE